MFLHVVGHNQRFMVVHQSFRRSIETVHRHFHQVLYAIGELRSEMIKPPPLGIHPKILESHRWNPYMQLTVTLTVKPKLNVGVNQCTYPLTPFFQDCIGAIDGTHVTHAAGFQG